MTNAKAWFSIALRPWKPEGLLGRTAQDGHLDSHTAPELYKGPSSRQQNVPELPQLATVCKHTVFLHI